MCVINDHLELDSNSKNIYPLEVPLKNKDISTSKASFLELSVNIENIKIKAQLYDKRDTLSFYIICMPHLDSKISSNIYYASAGYEILKFSRTKSDINIFATLFSRLFKKMQRDGSKHQLKKSMLNKTFGK